MHSGDLTAEQLDAIQARLQPSLGLLKRLLERMTAQGFPPSDPLRLRALCALDQLELLQTTLQRLAQARLTRDDYLLGLSPRDYKRQLRDKRNG